MARTIAAKPLPGTGALGTDIVRASAKGDAMHELSLCEAIADSVTRHAAGRPVRRASIRIGYLRQAVPESMSFCWEVLTDGTDLADCELEIEHVPAVVACGECGEVTTLGVPVLLCGVCGSSEVALESGDEMLLVSIDLAGVP
jgi:hydrogenase nickel incorporation protein HypA/HybF